MASKMMQRKVDWARAERNRIDGLLNEARREAQAERSKPGGGDPLRRRQLSALVALLHHERSTPHYAVADARNPQNRRRWSRHVDGQQRLRRELLKAHGIEPERWDAMNDYKTVTAEQVGALDPRAAA